MKNSSGNTYTVYQSQLFQQCSQKLAAGLNLSNKTNLSNVFDEVQTADSSVSTGLATLKNILGH